METKARWQASLSHHCSGCLALSINRRTQEVKTQPELLHQIMQLTIPVNQGNIKFGQKVECFGCQNTEFKATDQPNLRRGELSREQTRTREESFRRLQCEQSRTAHVMTTILKGGSILSGSSFAPETKNILKGLGRTVPHQMVIGKQVEKTEQLS